MCSKRVNETVFSNSIYLSVRVNKTKKGKKKGGEAKKTLNLLRGCKLR